ncbi:MAG TPA: tetratricopeptide repeat protein [Candidatus Sulfotelmatobacter sp.]|nr:tetratricopeptide repeat protein [Candidatus Sulfotelmatobacter sp.]
MATPALKLQTRTKLETGLFQSPEKRRIVLALLLGLLTLAIYNPIAQNGFVSFDDPGYVTGNRHIQAGLSWQTLRWAMGSEQQANWHPLTWVSHALDYQLFHLKPAGHHYISLLLHAVTAILLFLFLESATGMAFRSATVAALFAVHPMNVESVAWVSERKNVLCMLFFVLGMWAYRWYVQHPSVKRYSLVGLMLLLALLSKPMAITFPFVLLLLDYWPLQRMRLGNPKICGSEEKLHGLGRLVLEKVPLLILSAGSAVITVIAQKGGGALRTEYAFPARLANAIVSYARYVGKAVWPAHLAVLYPFPQKGLPAWEVAASAVLIIAISAGIIALERRRYLAFGWFWFLGTLVPMIGLVQVGEQAMADRYAYLPFVGLFIAVVWGLSDWFGAKPNGGLYLGATALAAVIGFSAVTRQQTAYWQNSIVLWSHTLAVTHDNFVAEDSLGAELIKFGRLQEARGHFQAAIAINPNDPFSQLDIGVCDKKLGNTQAAIEHYQSALRLASDPTLRATAFSNLGALYRMSGDYASAEQEYASSLAIQPENALGLYGMGFVAQKAGHLDRAIEFYAHAVRTEPSDVGYILLAQALEKDHREQEAQAAMEKAKKLSPDIQSAQQAVDRLLSE